MILLGQPTFAQNGPGGVGTTVTMGLWLDGDVGITVDGSNHVTQWSDQSGNGNHIYEGAPGKGPDTTSYNGHKVLQFNDGVTDQYLKSTSLSSNYASKTVAIVFMAIDNNSFGSLWGDYYGGVQLAAEARTAYTKYTWSIDGGTTNQGKVSLDGGAYGTTAENPKTPKWTSGQYHVALMKVDGSAVTVDAQYIGWFRDVAGHWLKGEVAEVVVYDYELEDDVERLRVVNYLARKYDISIGGLPNALFTIDDYENNLLVIGEYNAVDFDSNVGDGGAFYIENNIAGDWGANELIFAGHNGLDHGTTSSDVDTESRWERLWYIDRQGTETATSINISFGMQDAFGVDNDRLGYTINDYKLLYRNGTSGNFSEVTTLSAVLTDQNKITFEVANADLIDGYYTLGIPGNNQWYSYLPNGDWDNPDTWTLDPSGTLYINDFAQTPSQIDEVKILNGRTVNVSTNNKVVTLCTIESGGTLDIASTSGHNLSTIAGGGKIRLSSDNFPTHTSKADFEVKGTTEYYGTSYSLASDETYFNVIVNLDNTADVLTLTSDPTINGALTIKSGEFQINDNSTNARTLDINGDLIVSSSGSINVGTTGSGKTDHVLYLAGDFLNKGTVKFSDVVAHDYSGGGYTAKVDVQFDNGGADQRVYLEGTTQFYTIISDKGPDNTYVLDISASTAANFELFGQNNSSSIDALDLVSGTVKLGSNIEIPVLKTNGQVYIVPAEATLWVNNAEVTMNSGNAIVVYGSLKVSGPYSVLTVGSLSGITMRETGIFEVEGGTVNINQFRRTISGGTHLGVYRQTGGYVTVGDLVAPYSSFHLFDLSEPGMSFIMEGGTLHVKRGSENVLGGVYINSDPDKINVTGGTLICETTASNDFSITTRAPFNNVTFINSGSGVREFDIITASSNTAHSPTTITDPMFNVYGNFKDSTGNVTLDHNGNNMKFYGDVYMKPGSNILYDAAKPNTTYFLGSGNSTLTFDHLSGANSQNFYRVEIDKDARTDTLFLSGLNKTTSSARDNDLLNVNKAFYLTQGTVDMDNYSMSLYCDTIYNAGVLGWVDWAGGAGNNANPHGTNDRVRVMDNPNGDVIHLFDLSGSIGGTWVSGEWGAFELNTASDYVQLEDNFSGVDRFVMRSGRMYLQGYSANINFITENWDNTRTVGNVSTYDKNNMFVAGGSALDRGFGYWIRSSGNQTFTFPLGIGLVENDVNARYTPLEIDYNGGGESKNMYVVLVDDSLPTTVIGGGEILTMYWKIEVDDFDNAANKPTVNSIQCYYDDYDVIGDESTYYPGKVLNVSPFTRSVVGNNGNVDHTTTNEIDFVLGTTIEEADYTAGVQGRFIGSPDVYYSIGTGGGNNQTPLLWSDPNTWSHDGHYTNATPATDYPDNGDIVFIGFNPEIIRDNSGSVTATHFIDLDVDVNVSTVYFNNETETELGQLQSSGWPYPQLNILSSIASAELGILDGRGKVSMDVTCNPCNVDPTLTTLEIPNVSGDFTAFTDGTNSDWNTWEYDMLLGNNTIGYLPPNLPSTYPRLELQGNGNTNQAIIFTDDIEVRSRLVLNNGGSIVMNDGADGDISVEQGIRMYGWNTDSYIMYQGSGDPRTISCGEIFTMQSPNQKFYVEEINNTGVAHKFIYGHSLASDRYMDIEDGMIDFYGTGGTPSYVEFEIDNYDTTVIYGLDTHTPEFYNVIINTLDTTQIRFQTNFNVVGPSNGNTTDKAFKINSGKVIIDDPSIDVDLSTGGEDYLLPQSATLELKAGKLNVSGVGTGLLLDGALEINGGTLDMNDATNDNYIQYTTSGFSSIDFTSGSLLVGGQFMRDIDDDQSNVIYNQSGGTARFGINGTSETARGVFEVIGLNSSFIHTGGDLIIERGNNSSTIGDVSFADLSNFTGTGVLTIGATTASPSGESISINSGGNTLIKLLVSGASSARAEAIIQNIEIEGLEIENGAIMDMNDWDLTITSDFTNAAGTSGYIGGTNTTKFVGGTVNITGDTEFNDVFVNVSSKLQLGNSTELEMNNVELTTFTSSNKNYVYDGGNKIFVRGDLINSSNFFSEGVNGGIVMNGTTSQTLSSARSNGRANFDKLIIDNSNNINGIATSGKKLKLIVEDSLMLESGILDIASNYLRISMVSGEGYSETKMIRNTGVLSASGIAYKLGVGNNNLTIPMGVQSKYTPVELNLNSTVSTNLVFKPVNQQHVTTISYSGDLVHFYWKVSSTTGGYDGELKFHYVQEDVQGDESIYGSAEFVNSDWILLKNLSGEVDIVNNIVTFDIPSGTTKIKSDFTCGDVETPEPNNAFPIDIPVYTSLTTGEWDDASIWQKDDLSNEVPQVGAFVVIDNGDVVSMVDDAIKVYSLELNGELEVDTTIKHNLGTITGKGTINLIDGLLPGGDYADFFLDTAGSVVLDGTTSYTIDPRITAVSAVTFKGTGTRTVPNLSMTVGGDMIIDGVTVNNLNGTDTRIAGDLTLQNGGSYLANGGGFEFYGVGDSRINGDFTGGNTISSFVLNKDVGNVILDSDISVDQSLDFTKGVFEPNGHKFLIDKSISMPTTAWDSSYIDGEVCVLFLNGEGTGFDYPVGNSYKYAPSQVLGVSAGEWCARYYEGDPLSNGFVDVGNLSPSDNPLMTEVSGLGVWEVTGPVSATATGVRLAWLGGNISDPSKVVVAEEVPASNYWASRSGAYNSGTGYASSGDALSFSTKVFAIASTAAVLPVELMGFKAQLIDEYTSLTWETASELNNDYFEIERSLDGVDFYAIGEVEGKGTKSSLTEYDFVDYNTPNGVIYYRLAQYDYDGTLSYSNITFVVKESEQVLNVVIAPNPSHKGQVRKVKVNSPYETYTLSVQDMMGNLEYVDYNRTATGEPFELNVDLTSGVYILRITSLDKSQSVRFVVE